MPEGGGTRLRWSGPRARPPKGTGRGSGRKGGGNPAREGLWRKGGRAFTLVELMVVVGILGLVLAIGIPSMFQMLRKDPMRQAISDVMEACTQARGQAILQGVPTEIYFNLHDRVFGVRGGGTPNSEGNDSDFGSPSAATISRPFSAHLSDALVVEILDVNFREMKEEEGASVHFYPNGTCDEFTLVLSWPGYNQYRKVSLDIMTSLADMEVIR